MTQPELPTTATVHPPLTIIDPPPPPPKPPESAQSEERPPADPDAPPLTDSPNAPPEQPKSESRADAPREQGAGKSLPPPVLGFEPENFDQMWRHARWLATTQFVAKVVQGKPQDVMYMLMFGKARGLTLMQSAQLYVIDGKVTMPAETMLSLILSSPHCKYMRPTKSTLDVAEWMTLRRGDDQVPVTMDYSIDEARVMGLLDKGKDEWAKANNQWRRQPRNMLRWRALTTLGRLVYPDVIGGFYEHSEVMDIVEMKGGNAEIVPLTKSTVDNAKDGTPQAIDLTLPETTDTTPPEMREAFRPPAERQPEPVRRGGTSSRVAEKAAAARQQGAADPKACTHCGVPVSRPGLCDACKS